MLINIKSMSLNGINGYFVDVQIDISNGLPSWDIVGLPDISVKESKERVRAAIKNSGYSLHSQKVVINLAPASTKKEGSFFDLPIAVGILSNMNVLNSDTLHEYVLIGELSLDGKLNKVNGILPMCIEALKLGIQKIIVPFENRFEAGIVKGLKVYPAQNLNEVISHFNQVSPISAFSTDLESIAIHNTFQQIDFSEVKGQENVKRALEIAAAGSHNCLLIGSPGSGKTMLSKRISSILPDLSFQESLEITKIHSIAGILPSNVALISARPFRSPHHTISSSALTGRW